MADHTHIEWTDATWNPITGCSITSPGCSITSPGCKICYAMRLAGTRLADHPSRAGLTRKVNGNHVWTGETRFNEKWIDQPLRWKKPRRIFVCAHGDLFHESVPDEWIDRVFAVMALSPHHQFQVLTKRADRMRAYCNDPATPFRIAKAIAAITEAPVSWPLPNVWKGVSVEDQTRADERIPDLLATPAAVRWLSMEPLLGEVRLSGVSDDRKTIWNWLSGEVGTMHFDGPDFDYGSKLDWIVVGAESGPGARPMYIDWVRSIRDQCRAAGVPLFVKQLSGSGGRAIKDIADFPADLRIREWPV